MLDDGVQKLCNNSIQEKLAMKENISSAMGWKKKLKIWP